jgi:hypothetical protein
MARTMVRLDLSANTAEVAGIAVMAVGTVGRRLRHLGPLTMAVRAALRRSMQACLRGRLRACPYIQSGRPPQRLRLIR